MILAGRPESGEVGMGTHFDYEPGGSGPPGDREAAKVWPPMMVPGTGTQRSGAVRMDRVATRTISPPSAGVPSEAGQGMAGALWKAFPPGRPRCCGCGDPQL